MKIGVDCPGCQLVFEVDADQVGKQSRCPHCDRQVRVPQHSAASHADATASSQPARDAAYLAGEGEETYGLATEPATAVAARVRAAKAARGQAKVNFDGAGAGTASTPTDAPRSSPLRGHRTPTEILAAFRGEIQPVRPTLLYRAWILIIAAVMVVLPAIYLALVAAVGMAVYWHAVHNIVVFQNVKQIKGALLVYCGPLAAGVVVLGFMLKPFFARAPQRDKVRRIDPDKEPLIVAFVDGVCRSVGAPTPSRIEVDCQVNASAYLASWVLAPSKELVLTIGLPLVAGLTLRQFTGVLAHEFGHFSQGAGMRLSVLIRSINRWFARVVYERDEWDETLVGWSGQGNGAIMLVVLVARLAIWITRRILWVLMHVGHCVSGFLSRQMEFDADRYETRMVGSGTFEETMARLTDLGLASQAAHSDLVESWRERRLPDDLARLILVKLADFPDPLRAAVHDQALAEKTGLFDTHPCRTDRNARAHAEGTDGIFRLDGPATDLFRDFDAMSRAATFDFYRGALGRGVTKEQLYPIAEAVLNKEVEREGNRAIDRFFLGALQMIQPVPLPDTYPQPPSDPRAAKRRLGELRRAMLAGHAANLEAAERWGEANGRAVQAEAALALFRADKKVKAQVVNLPRATLGAADEALAQARTGTQAALADFEPFATLAAERLTLALGLLELDLVAARVADGAVLRDEARSLYPAATVLGRRVVPELSQFLPTFAAVGFLIKLFQAGKNDKDQAMINALLRGTQSLHERLTQLRWKVGDALGYPFEHAHQGITLGRFIIPNLPDAGAVGEVVQAADEAQDRVLDLHRRVLGRLAAAAEAVEVAIGLPPVEVPAAGPDS